MIWDDKYIPEPNSGCWLWLLSVDKNGYGKHGNDRAHREAYRRYKGALKGLSVLHKCDQPSCINPEHLFLGTQIDNIRDKVSKGRQRASRGINHSSSKLTAEQVLSIRTDLRFDKVIAKEYSVSSSTVNRIKNKVSYVDIG